MCHQNAWVALSALNWRATLRTCFWIPFNWLKHLILGHFAPSEWRDKSGISSCPPLPSRCSQSASCLNWCFLDCLCLYLFFILRCNCQNYLFTSGSSDLISSSMFVGATFSPPAVMMISLILPTLASSVSFNYQLLSMPLYLIPTGLSTAVRGYWSLSQYIRKYFRH